MYDPANPVGIVAVGISQDADMVSLGKMAEVTSGGAFLAEQRGHPQRARPRPC